MEVHEEPASKVSEKGFRRFLVDTPLDVRLCSRMASHPLANNVGSVRSRPPCRPTTPTALTTDFGASTAA